MMIVKSQKLPFKISLIVKMNNQPVFIQNLLRLHNDFDITKKELSKIFLIFKMNNIHVSILKDDHSSEIGEIA